MQESPVGHGGSRDGAGRPKGALNKLSRPVKELAADQSAASIKCLVNLRDHAESEAVRFAAAKELLDRACGRPKQEISVEDKSVTIIVNRSLQPVHQPQPPMTIEHQPGETEGPLGQ